MTHTVYSFDVFDTCLVRNIARPEDIFVELARRLLPVTATPEEIAELAKGRIEAEAQARRMSGREDILLGDIYACFKELSFWRISPETMMHAEIELEQNSVSSVALIRQKIQALRQRGERVIFISDMYLPPAIIKQMLVAHQLALPGDAVYVSGEIGLTKHSGNLFRYVLQQEGIKPAQLWHCGDNPHSDVLMPRRLGIKTTFFRQSQLNRYERLAMHPSGYCDSRLTSRLAGISRATRLALPPDDLAAYLSPIAGVIAPLLTAFVAWLLRDAQQRGISRLYFVSRDGQILHKIASQFARQWNVPECRYLYGSRQAWFLSSVTACNRQNLDWLLADDKTPASLLQKLAVDPAEITPVLARYNFDATTLHRPLGCANVEQFWQLVEDPAVADLVLARAAANRQTVLAYFAQEQLTAGGAWALVDVGWAARGQRAIRQLLRTQDSRREVCGYYLALADNRRPLAETGPYWAFILPSQTEQFESPGRLVLNNTMLIEHLFVMANHGTVVGYVEENRQFVPVFKETPTNEFLRAFIERFQQTILHYSTELIRSEPDLAAWANLQPVVLELIRNFIAQPDRVAAQLAAQIPFVVAQTHANADYKYLARPLGWRDLAYIGRYFLLSRLKSTDDRPRFAPGYAWREGSLALSAPWIRLLFRPISIALQFKQNHGRRQIYNYWARLVSNKLL